MENLQVGDRVQIILAPDIHGTITAVGPGDGEVTFVKDGDPTEHLFMQGSFQLLPAITN